MDPTGVVIDIAQFEISVNGVVHIYYLDFAANRCLLSQCVFFVM